MTPTHQVFLGLGSNVGDRVAALREAAERLKPYVDITGRSHIYETKAADAAGQPAFLNAVVGGFTEMEPVVLLYTLKEIEREIGRQPTFKYGPRVIDIDILFYDDLRLASPELTIPHPRAIERSFVLKPMADIAPDFRDPASAWSVTELLGALGGLGDISDTGETL